MHSCTIFFQCDYLSADPEDYSSAMRYNVTFHQTAFTDGGDPADTALSSPILIDVIDDYVFDGVEYFQTRIVETSDRFRVRIGQDTVNITITDSEFCLFGMPVKAFYNCVVQWCVELLCKLIP